MKCRAKVDSMATFADVIKARGHGGQGSKEDKGQGKGIKTIYQIIHKTLLDFNLP